MKRMAAAFLLTLSLAWVSNAQVDDRTAFLIGNGSSFAATGRSPEKATRSELAPGLSKIGSDVGEVLNIVLKNHVSGRNLRSDKVISSAISTALGALDPHSSYFTPQEFRALNDAHHGRYFGIGTTISSFAVDGTLETFVLSTRRGSPAEKAGLRFGDRIIGVDGKPVVGMESYEVRDLVRGPLNSQVKLTVERVDGSVVKDVAIQRAKVVENSVGKTLILGNGIGYIGLREGFDLSTSFEFERAFRTLKQSGMTSLIVDLRGNGGGLVDQAIAIAEKFLPAGQMIMTQRGRRPSQESSYRSTNRKPESLPLAFLVDGETASASEILAAAMQDNDRALIVGERTFGKGLVQNVIELPDGAGLTLTSERYYTPSGRTLQREYSDGSLYDYFKHTNRGVLVGKAETAFRTRNGRSVFGGDGVEPDVISPGFEAGAEHTKVLDALFSSSRKTKDPLKDEHLVGICGQARTSLDCGKEFGYLRLNAAQLNLQKFGTESIYSRLELTTDPQVEAAMKLMAAGKRP